MGCVWEQNTIPHTKLPSKRMSEITFIKKMNSGRIRSRVENRCEKVVHSSEGSRSLNRRIELKFGGVVDMGVPHQRNGWIFQRISELGSGDHALNSSGFPSRFDRAPVYRRLPEILHRNSTKFCMAIVDLIPHNSTEGIVKAMLKEVVAADTSSLSRKTARSPGGNVDIEAPSSEDNSSMIMIEIGVDVDEGPRPNMTTGGRAQSSVNPR